MLFRSGGGGAPPSGASDALPVGIPASGRMVDERGKPYTLYCVKVSLGAEAWSVTHRYREFARLHAALQQRLCLNSFPCPKRLFVTAEVIRERQTKLAESLTATLAAAEAAAEFPAELAAFLGASVSALQRAGPATPASASTVVAAPTASTPVARASAPAAPATPAPLPPDTNPVSAVHRLLDKAGISKAQFLHEREVAPPRGLSGFGLSVRLHGPDGPELASAYGTQKKKAKAEAFRAVWASAEFHACVRGRAGVALRPPTECATNSSHHITSH